MKKRQIIIIAVAVLIVVAAKLVSDVVGTPKERPKPQPKEKINTVFVDTVALSDIPIIVESTGRLQAVDRIELYSEVQGAMLPDGGRFRAGTSFRKGETLFSIRADDQRAAVISSRSNFLQNLSTVMPDIRLDHEESYPAWNTFLSDADAETGVPILPDNMSESLERFLTGRGILSSYYAMRNAEAQLAKYTIRAPFSGVLTEASVIPGSVVRTGTRLGLFLRPEVYELEVAVDASTIHYLEIGQMVELSKADSEQRFNGEIVRVNKALDPSTQLCSFFVKVSDPALQDGMYLQAQVQAATIEGAFRVSRSTLLDQQAVYVVQDSLLRRQEVEVLHTNSGSTVIRGLKDGQVVLSQVPPDAFEGMKVQIYTKKQPA
jgi:multidrug efflux pump subunit AcrA (membrane-fusion protein)